MAIHQRAVEIQRNFESMLAMAEQTLVGESIEQLLQNHDAIMIHRQGEDISVSVTGKTRSLHRTGETLLECLKSFSGGAKKRCSRCKEWKPVMAFSRLSAAPDGRNFTCLQCERERVKGHARSKKSGKSG